MCPWVLVVIYKPARNLIKSKMDTRTHVFSHLLKLGSTVCAGLL